MIALALALVMVALFCAFGTVGCLLERRTQRRHGGTQFIGWRGDVWSPSYGLVAVWLASVAIACLALAVLALIG